MTNLPVSGIFTVTAAYGETGKYWKNGHKGIDIVCSNRQIYATCEGEVYNTGFDETGWGYWVSVKDGEDRRHIFCHLAKGSIKVKKGDKVTRLTVIGTMGDTGNVTGVHLHYQINVNGVAVNPADCLGIPNRRGTYNSMDYSIKENEMYKDEKKISNWAKEAVKKVTDEDIMQGDGTGYFNPQGYVTREQIAVIIERLIERK